MAGGSGSFRKSSANVSMASMKAPAFNGGLDAGFFASNSKETMNNLNDRLASYLEKVRFLEQSNNDLEAKIHEFYAKTTNNGAIDTSGYYATISKLQAQIEQATIDNTRLVLEIDNTKLATIDFKLKLELEQSIRLAVENDLSGLRKLLDQLTLVRSDLEVQIESLKEELIIMKKNHEKELANCKSQIRGEVNVEEDFAAPVDLSKILAEVRQQSENIVEKNRQEVEMWYQAQTEILSKEVAVCKQSYESSSREVTELKRKFQSLSIELQSLLQTKQALEGILVHTEGQYGAQLGEIQNLISQVELDLRQLRSDYDHHVQEYGRLLEVKLRLEQEIATYTKLLDGENLSTVSASRLATQKSDKIVSKEEAEISTK
ncbi:keratin, type I cytoskeletal 47 kDa-like [Leptodactylus fuscus]